MSISKDEALLEIVSLFEQGRAISAINHIHAPIVREFEKVVNEPPAHTTISYKTVTGFLTSLRYVVTVSPTSGKWKDGNFRFQISVPRYYKPGVPVVMCLNPEEVSHPNISHDGRVALRRIDESPNWEANSEHTLLKLTQDVRDLFMKDIDPLNKILNTEAEEETTKTKTPKPRQRGSKSK